MKPLLVVAGEASGDLHGGEILRHIKERCPDQPIWGVGGQHMTPFLDRKLADVSDLGVMGLVEPLLKIPQLLNLRRQMVREVRDAGIRHVLTIDYPGFNLSLAKLLRAECPDIRLHHYVCPQVWAWKASRIPKIGQLFNTLYCLFDFEPELFKAFPVDARFVGNPLLEVVQPELDRAAFFQFSGLNPERPVVALLPGSRMTELKRLLPPMLEMVKAWPVEGGFQWVLPVASTLPTDGVKAMVGHTPVTVIEGHSYAARAYAEAALVCSGTATLETALLGTPFAILYRMNPLTLALARRVVKLPHFGLVNVVARRGVVQELLQEEVNAQTLAEVLRGLLEPEKALSLRSELAEIRSHLGQPGAALRVGEHLCGCLTQP